MMRFLILIAMCFCTALAFTKPLHAQDQKSLMIDLASDHIDVSVGFTGSTIEIFGDRRDPETDVAIIVEGPERPITIWRKARIFGTWVNRHFVRFNKIPVYYNYAVSSEDFIDANPELSKRHRIGIEQMMATRSIKKSKSVEDIQEFRDILVDGRIKSGNFPVNAGQIKFLNDHFFRVGFKIPPSVPTGEYKISSYLVKNGEVIEAKSLVLKVEQIGVNAFVLKSSQEHALLYSFFCILFAALSGWFVSIIRVRI